MIDIVNQITNVTKFLSAMMTEAKVSKEAAKNSLNDIAYSENAIKSQFNKAMRQLNFELPLTRNMLIKVGKIMNLNISYLKATEAICFCRGPELE